MAITAGQPILASDFISSSAGAADSGKGVKVDTNGEIDTSFRKRFLKTGLSVVENMDGTTTPVAVMINANGAVQKSEADVTNNQNFIGFVTSAITTAESEYVNSSSNSGSTTISATANAGSNRVLLLHLILEKTGGGSPAAPSGITWNGNAMTLVNSQVIDTIYFNAVYSLAIGTSLTNQTANIVITGGTFTAGKIFTQWDTHYGVDQTTPVDQKAKATATSTTPSVVLDPTAIFARIVNFLFYTDSTGIGSWNAGQTTRQSDVTTAVESWRAYISDVPNKFGGSTTYNATIGSSAWGIHVIELKPAIAVVPTATVQMYGIVPFTGLTAGAKYFVSNTGGAIATSAGSTSVKVGKAISATELLIIHD